MHHPRPEYILKMFCSVVFSSLLLIQREGVSASYLTPNTEIQYSPKPANAVNNSSYDYTELPRRKRRTFGNQGIIKRRNGAKKRRHQNREDRGIRGVLEEEAAAAETLKAIQRKAIQSVENSWQI